MVAIKPYQTEAKVGKIHTTSLTNTSVWTDNWTESSSFSLNRRFDNQDLQTEGKLNRTVDSITLEAEFVTLYPDQITGCLKEQIKSRWTEGLLLEDNHEHSTETTQKEIVQ